MRCGGDLGAGWQWIRIVMVWSGGWGIGLSRAKRNGVAE